MKIKDGAAGGVTILQLSGKIMGGGDFDLLQDRIKALIAAGRTDVLLELSGVSWVNSSGLGILVSAYTSLRNAGGRMKICAVSQRVDGILIVSGLKRVFEVHDTEAEALAAFASDPARP